MHPTRPYYTSNIYSSNVVDIGDPYTISQQPMASTSMVTLQQTSSYSGDQGAYKKRKIERACDACRRRKTKCDGPRMSDNVCTNCVQNRKTCTYVYVRGYHTSESCLMITVLTARLRSLEDLQRRMCYLRSLTNLIIGLKLYADISPVLRTGWKEWRHF
jgi:hypothetical protein